MAFPSTFADLKSAVIGKVRLDSTADASRAGDWINQVYAQVCVETEANQTSGTAVLTANAATYTLPASVLRIKSLAILPSGQSAYGLPLTETSLEDIIARRQANGTTVASSASSTHYALAGLTGLELWPTPGSADTLLFYYVALPTALSGGTDVPILQEPYGSKLLEYGALAEAADFLKDPDVDRYRALYDLWMKKFRAHLNRRAGGHTWQIPVAGRTGLPHDRSMDIRAVY